MDENFAITLTDATKTHEEWLAVVQFGMATLLANQPLLFEILSRQASVLVERKGLASWVTADAMRQIFTELNLKISIEGAA